MSLTKSILLTEIRKINDKDFASFEGFPENETNAALMWSDAVNEYAKTVTPASATSEAAKSAFYATFLALLQAKDPNMFTNALTSYAAALGAGMTGFVAVPPPLPCDLSAVFAEGLAGASAQKIATDMSDIIDLWFKTGTATPVGGGSPIPWS